MVRHFGRPLGWDEMVETLENKFHKSHLCKWCSLSDYAGTPPRELPIAQGSLSDSMLSEWKPLLIVWILPFPLNPSRDQQKRGKCPVLRTYAKSHQFNQEHENFLLHNLITFVPQILVPYLQKWSKPWNHKAEASDIFKKVRAMLVLYLLLGIRILVYSCTVCGISNIHLCLEDNRSSFSRVSLKPKTKDVRP